MLLLIQQPVVLQAAKKGMDAAAVCVLTQTYRCCLEACALSSLLLCAADLIEALELGPAASFFCLCLSRALGPARRPALWACEEMTAAVTLL